MSQGRRYAFLLGIMRHRHLPTDDPAVFRPSVSPDLIVPCMVDMLGTVFGFFFSRH